MHYLIFKINKFINLMELLLGVDGEYYMEEEGGIIWDYIKFNGSIKIEENKDIFIYKEKNGDILNFKDCIKLVGEYVGSTLGDYILEEAEEEYTLYIEIK